ncbi:Hypothetical protein A7982_08158 [Minicystis rosea]|nr:Hypothetical protein A7982_08158 [Minicystis rosea]
MPCWTYMSEGLVAEGQHEIAFSVKREPGEAEDAYPRTLLELYATIHGFAQQKQIVHEGGMTRINRSRPGMLRDDLHGILYTPPQLLDGVKATGPFLTGIFVTGPEQDAIDRFGHARFMALLGKRYRFYPTTPWLDRKRPELTRPEKMASSVLAKAGRMQVGHAYVRRETTSGGGAKVVFTLQRKAGQRLTEAFGELGAAQIGMALYVDVDPEADALLLWEPGQMEAAGIAKPGATGARLAGGFLLLATGTEEDGAKPIEDGFGLLLTERTWAAVRAAIAEGRPIQVPPTGSMLPFEIAWVEESYSNPFDGRTYAGHFVKYQATGSAAAMAAAPNGIVDLAGIRLLQPEAELAQRTSSTDLGNYIKQIAPVIESVVGKSAEGPRFDIMVQFELSPGGKADVKVAARPPEISYPPEMPSLSERIQRVPVPAIREGSVRFLAGYTVRGGTGEQLP